MRIRTVVSVVVVVVVAAVVTAIAVLMNTDFNQYRPLIAQKVKEATGRDLKIGGDLKVVLGLQPSVAVNNVSFANAPWGTRPHMVEAKRFEIRIDLLPLLFGNISVDKLVLIDTHILLETDRRGRGNWDFEPAGAKPAAPAPSPSGPSGPTRLPAVHEVFFEGVLLRFRDGETGVVSQFSLGHLQLKADSDTAPLKLDINGTYNDFYFEVNGQTGPAAALTSSKAPLPLDLTAKLGATPTTVHVQGQIADPTTATGYDLRITAVTDEIAQISDFLRDAHAATVPLPRLGPLNASLRVTDGAPGGKPSLPAIKIEAGRSELALAKADGAIRELETLKGVNLNVTLEGAQIAALSGLVLPGLPQGLPAIPALGPYKLAVKAASGQGDRLALPNVKLDLGRDDLLKLTVDGAIQQPLERKGFALNIAADAPELTSVAQLLQVSAPVNGPLALRGKIADAGPDRYALSGLKLAAAGSDIGGDATLALGGARPTLTAALASSLVDLGKLMPPKSAASAAPQKSDGRVFSADPLPFELLKTADAELRYKADAIRTPDGPAFRDVTMQATLRNGELAVRPIAATIGGGTITGELAGSDGTGAVAARVSIKGVELGAIDQEVPGQNLVTGGKTDAEIDVRGTGKSVRALMATLNGTIVATISAGTFTSRYTDMLGLGQLTDVVATALPRVERVQLNCFVSRFEAKDGIATGRPIVVDTGRLTMYGGGTIDLKAERPDMRLNTHTKVTSLLSLMPPIYVGGTLADPSFTPDIGGGAVDAVGDLLGGVLGLPGRIFGGDEPPRDICARAIARATGRPAAQSGAAPQPQAQPAQPSKTSDPVQDLGKGIERNLRGIFGR